MVEGECASIEGILQVIVHILVKPLSAFIHERFLT